MTVFADRIVQVSFIEGAVRLQFIAATGQKDGSGNSINETVQTVVMTEHGFLASFETLAKAKLEAETRAKGGGATAAVDPATVAPKT